MVYLPPQPLLHAGHPMTRQTPIQVCLLAGVLIWTGAMGQPGEAFGADPKTPGTSWGDYVSVGKVIAEVRSSDGDSLKMRVYCTLSSTILINLTASNLLYLKFYFK